MPYRHRPTPPRSSPPPSHDWPPQYPVNGHGYDLTMMLVHQGHEQHRQTEILLAVHDRIIDLPDRIAARLAPLVPPSASAVPPPTAPATSAPPAPALPAASSSGSAPSLLSRLGSIRDLMLLASAAAMLAAVLAGKMHWADAAQHLRCLAGLPCVP